MGHYQEKNNMKTLDVVTKKYTYTDIRYIKKIMIHPDFNASTKFPDLAILMFRKFEKHQNPFKQPKMNQNLIRQWLQMKYSKEYSSSEHKQSESNFWLIR